MKSLRAIAAVTALAWAGVAMPTHAAPAQPCRVDGLAHEVLCGSVARALDPARPDGPQIEVHYVVVPALARRKLPDPVFLLAGGPGQSAISLAPQVMGVFARLNNRRDIVFVDQRGTGRSAPLDCDGPREVALAESADPQAQLRRLAACRERLLKLPYVRSAADLGFFTTTLAMQDLDAVRQAIGAERINLVGASYGTRAGLEYQRQFPVAVRRSVHDGVAPPDMVLPASAATDAQAALDALFTACAAEAACAREWPLLRQAWDALLASLPRAVSVPDPLTGKTESFTLTRELLLGAVRAPLYVPTLAAALPAAIHAASQGRFEALAALAGALSRRGGPRLYTGMHFAVICVEDAPRMDSARAAATRDFGDGLAPLYAQACTAWPRGAVPEAFYKIGPAATPVLLLSGGIDPATPPRHAARVVQALGAKARHVVVPNAGHGLLASGCVPDLLYRFIDAADDTQALALDTACITAIPRPGAFVPPAPEAAK
ncbi:alpha/beta hydrolase [Rhizobacter sp. AJA081-3]|uniref:alpha/beta hydrolase n=1 Tax=Rhizobacter sp. AJA081-3 TaxID=2753607 RepID=UPI001FD84842|nr:alpha/beta hydrolase [Rhizobacter sp. AJA081-3]